MLRIKDIKLDMALSNGCAGYGDWYDGPRSWSLAKAFAAVKNGGYARLAPRDKDEFDGWISEHVGRFLRSIEDGRDLRIGEVTAAWYYARTQEITDEWMADETMTYQAYKSKLSGVRRQVTGRV